VLIVQVIDTLNTSSHIEPWAARAAGLVFAQYFWFMHCFLLTTHQGEAVQQLVVSMLSDRKLEVQDLAAASLSGWLIPMLLHIIIHYDHSMNHGNHQLISSNIRSKGTVHPKPNSKTMKCTSGFGYVCDYDYGYGHGYGYGYGWLWLWLWSWSWSWI